MQEQTTKTRYTWRTEAEIDFDRQKFLTQRLAITPDIQQGIGPSARAGELHDRDDTVGLPGSQGHRPSRGMVRSGIDA